MINLADYDYHLEKERIATSPATPKDSARLFVYDTRADAVHIDTFHHLYDYLTLGSLIVFNNTKVIPSRAWLRKESFGDGRGGGKVQVLLMMNELRPGDTLIKGVVDRKLLVGAKLFFKTRTFLEVARQEDQFFFFKPSIPMHNLWALLQKEGVTPIPPYIKGNTMSEHALREKYQSVLAKYPASIAAPTASLHFTNRLLKKLDRGGTRRAEVTLHVGAGTFAPIDESNFKSKKLFTELYDIPEHTSSEIHSAKLSGIPIIPVGTTALRALESAAVLKNGLYAAKTGSRSTNIFIYPPYKFKIADGLVTNFHVPRSSLMLLVDALLRHKKAKRGILELYDIAIREKFRFYSFGDGMLIL